jgi:hypothetical protein
MPSSLVGVKGISISQNRPTHTLSLDAEYQCKRKSPPQDGFGNTFGNKGVVSLQILVPPIDLAGGEIGSGVKKLTVARLKDEI